MTFSRPPSTGHRHRPFPPAPGQVIAIDTDVLVRLVVADDAAQARRARRLVEANEVLVPASVLLESEWVLRHAYGFTSAQIAGAFRRLLGLPNVAPDSPSAVARALDANDSGLDFADALHLAMALGASQIFTFDRQFARAARILAPGVSIGPA
jgi:predicted nucleic acid-binding protein